MTNRRKTRTVMVGSVEVGGNAPIAIQSMTNTHTDDIEATVKQIHELEALKCNIIRVAVLMSKQSNASVKSKRG